MKKLTLCLFTAFFLVSFFPRKMNAGTEMSEIKMIAAKSVESAHADALPTTLDQININNNSTISASENNDLQKQIHVKKQGNKGHGSKNQEIRIRSVNSGPGYRDRNQTIRVRGDNYGHNAGYYDRRHNNGTVYFSVGGGLLVILLLILLL